MLHLTVLGSGSSGNCAVITSGSTTLLLDAGLSAKQIVLRLESIGLTLDALDGTLLTREHQDYTGGLVALSIWQALPLFFAAQTADPLLVRLEFRQPSVVSVKQSGQLV